MKAFILSLILALVAPNMAGDIVYKNGTETISMANFTADDSRESNALFCAGNFTGIADLLECSKELADLSECSSNNNDAMRSSCGNLDQAFVSTYY